MTDQLHMNMLLAVLSFISNELDAVTAEDFDNPFENSGGQFICKSFEVIAYDWNEDENYTQPYNFKWKDFEVKWYKHLGRAMETNREISYNEMAQLLNDCLLSLTKYYGKKKRGENNDR